jgi:hypothetical protein
MDMDNLIKLSDAYMELKYRCLKEGLDEATMAQRLIKELQLNEVNYDKLKKYVKTEYDY